jgi:hypothetical protein
MEQDKTICTAILHTPGIRGLIALVSPGFYGSNMV